MVNNIDTKVRYRGNGSNRVFPITFPFTDDDYVCVRIANDETGEVRELTSDFLVDNIANTVTYPGWATGQEPPVADQPAVLTSDETITIYRKTEISQLIELGIKFPLPQIEQALDKVTNILQEHDEAIVRSVKVDIASEEEAGYYYEQMMVAANNAVESATAAAGSATSAANSASAAASSETAAAISATNAADSASAAAASALSASNSAAAAGTSANNAAASESVAGNAATSATASASAATISAESASASKLSAESSAGTAVANAAISTSAANTAQNAATTCSEVLPQVLGAASNVATKASAAAASATAAALSANAAETASQTAVNAADDAQDAADDAIAAANAAAVSAGAAATSATQAETANTEAKYYAKITMDKIAESAVGYPSQVGTITYDGTVKTPTWDVFYEPQKLTITGDTSATNAGTYTITMTPKATYYWWDDDTTTAKTQTWTIGKAAITTVPSQSGVVVYDGTEQAPTWANYDPAKLTIGGVTAGTEAGTYTATFTPTANYKWEDGTTTAKSVTWEISAATVTIPTVTDTSKTFTGAAQAPTITGLDAQTVEVRDDVTAVNAGSYMITFHLKSPSLIWSDETSNDKSFAWSIGPKAVTAPTVTGTSFIYDGTSQGPTIGSYDTDAILVSGTTEAIGAGSYSVIFSLVSATNYKWSDNTTEPKSVAWAITPSTVAVPALSNKSKTYNGSAQSPTVSPYDSNLVEVTGTTTAINAGSYTVTFHLLNPNVTWADETTADKTDTWEIAKAAGSMSLSKITVSLDNNTTGDTVTVTRAGDGAISAVSSNTSYATASVSGNVVTITGVASGSTTITVSVAEGTNYLAPTDETVSVAVQFGPSSTLNDNSWETISQVAQAGEGDLYWDIGDVKMIELNGKIGDYFTADHLQLGVFILDFNHPENGVAENNIIFGGFKTALSGGKDVALCDSKYNSASMDGSICFNMNHKTTATSGDAKYGYNYGGWKGSDLRYDILGATSTAPSQYNVNKNTSNVGYDATAATLTSPKANTLLAALPSDLRNVLRLRTHYVDNKGNKSNVDVNVTSVTDAVSLLAEYEVFGSRGYANQYEQNHQTRMKYYANGNSTIKYKHSDTSAAVRWWECSPNYDTSSNFCAVLTNGHAVDFYDAYYSTGYARMSNALAPALKI